MEPKATLIETPFHAIKSKFNKDTIHIIDHTFIRNQLDEKNSLWPNNPIYFKDPSYMKKKDRSRSVPSSSSSPSLPLIKRSMTGSSISSTNSSLSTGSLRKQHWSQWFTPPPLPTPLPTKPVASSPESKQKRARVIKELIETEKSYQSDLVLIHEIYYQKAPLSALEKKQIFINLLDLLIFEKEFVDALDQLQDQDDIGSLCKIFLGLLSKMEHLYAEYCKKHEDALIKIQEQCKTNPKIQEYFAKCQQEIQGKTRSWDLSSLLIKPVQRVLKYPLLFKEILLLTPEYNVDYESLVLTHHEIELLADHINEIKKRKDIVEQLLVNDHKNKVVHGINKKWTRKVYMKRQHTSMGTQDNTFDDIYKQFENVQDKAKQFEKKALEWLKTMKASNDNLKDFLILFDKPQLEQTLLQMAQDIHSTETMIQVSVCDRIESFLKLFKNPAHVIEKRNKKWIDYDRACHIASKGEVPDKQLQTSAEAYTSINAHLLDELPTFLSLVSTYFDIILDEFVGIQAFYWKQREATWKPLLAQDMPESQEEMSWVDFLHDNEKPKIPETTISEISIPEITIPEISISEITESIFGEPMFECVILTDYETKEELKLRKGDVIQVWHTLDDDEQWCYGSRINQSGWFPSSVCKKKN